MYNAARRARVRIPERACLLSEDWLPDSFNPEHKARDNQAIARIQGYNHGDLFGQVVAVPGVTLNGKPVKLLVPGIRNQPRDLLDHREMVESIGLFASPRRKPSVDLEGLIEHHLANRPITVD
jgi:hypothetical protein